MSQLQMKFLSKNSANKSILSTLQPRQSQFVLSTSQHRPRPTTTSPFSLYSCKGLGTMIKDFNSIPKGCKSCGH